MSQQAHSMLTNTAISLPAVSISPYSTTPTILTPLDRVQNICGSILSALERGVILDLSIPRYQVIDAALATEDEVDADAPAKTVSFLRSNTSESYTRILAVLALVAELLACNNYYSVAHSIIAITSLLCTFIDGNTISQRDVYYSMKYLFKTQKECNATIIDTGLLLGLKRTEMNIVPSSRGFVAGCVRFKFNDDDHWTDGLAAISDGGVSISSQWTSCADENLSVDTGPARCLLVIEKQGIFHRLCEDNFQQRFPCIMVTGCGFPDIATRALVSRLAKRFPV
jgi:DNA topoisomerase VI subunit A